MRVVIAPDTFKESLAATQVAEALAAGVFLACPDAQVDLCPMADGGDGTVAAVVAATGGEMLTADVFGPLGQPVRARFGLLGERRGRQMPLWDAARGAGRTAVIEMAAASGLALVPVDKRDPMRTTTFGTGQLILAALDAGAGRIIVGLGGSATVDGGCGCAQALGVTFTDASGQPCVCGLAGGGLADVEGIDVSGRDPRIASAVVRVACDVTNPLTGPNGAAAVYAPQKGATAEMVERLEAGLVHLAAVIRRCLKLDVERMRGAGAAGGLAAGLVAFAGATIESGLELVADAVGLTRRLEGADLCITGEGRLDGQSLSGKTAVGVAEIARRCGVPTVCIPGQAAPDAPSHLFVGVLPLAAEGVSVREAMHNPQPLLKRRASEAVWKFLDKRR